jgi:hypothetical protein
MTFEKARAFGHIAACLGEQRRVYHAFIRKLRKMGYSVHQERVFCEFWLQGYDEGIEEMRKNAALLAA